MCGIAGFAVLDGTRLTGPVDEILSAMAHALRPRGPDDMQFANAGPACMSFTRLSLVDPEGGRQPFVTEDGSVILAANGEIYNHEELRREFGESAFRSRSDCEVLLQLYLRDGLDFLERVRGMFGIAVIDLRKQRIVLARDRIGLKPLFVYRQGSTLIFGSEVKALFAHPDCPRELDWLGALADQGFAAAPIMPFGKPMNWFLGVEQIDPGTIVTFDLRDGATTERRYWTMPEPCSPSDAPASAYVERLRALLAESTTECLMADAEIGVMLSGGVDSAGIAALSAGTVRHSYSVVMPSTVVNGDADFGRESAATLGLTHHEVAFPADLVPSAAGWRRLLWLMESPLCGPEQYFKSEIYRFARAHRPGLKAMLLGSGADELAGGYTQLLASGGDWYDFMANITEMARKRALAGPQAAMSVWWDGPDPLVSEDAANAVSAGQTDPYDQFVAWKVRDWQQYNFWVEDRTASGNAVEARVPYLDHRIVELLAMVPREYRRELFWNKAIIRSALADLLPTEILARPKIAFYHGEGVHHTHRTFARMLAQDGDALLEEALTSPRACQYLDPDNIRAALRRYREGPSDGRFELLLRVVNLGLLDSFTVDVPHTKPSTDPLPVEITAAGDERSAQLLALAGGHSVADDDVLAFSPDVLLLDSANGESYLAVDGSLRFVIDHRADADWLSLLRGFDGKRDLAAVAADADVDLSTLTDLVKQSVDLGLLQVKA
jgi:asparagine synthase (glutamine-hydrolysing)